jgi:hypothetical protein
MFKSALAIVLLANVHALNLNARTEGKHDFIKAMRKSQKVNGMLPRKLSNDKLIAKSVHKPGLRSSTAQIPASKKTATESAGSVTDRKSKEPIKRQVPTKRHLNSEWWKWWKSNSDLTDEEIENMNNMDEEELQDYMNGTSSWWSWNSTGNSNGTDADAEDDDIWSTGENQTFVKETLADFSVKYVGCSSLTSYVDSDEEGSYPFVNQNFVSYRLCPSESCADDSWNGCKSVYGEYLMNLEDFLTVQQDYLDEEFEYYCNYCEQCIYFNTYFSDTDEEGQGGCSQTEACYDYDDYCSDEARTQMEEEAEFSIEDFFECKEIDIWGGDDDNGDDATVVDDKYQFGDDRYNVFYKNEGKAYIGSHCNDGIITIRLFADDQCIHYVGNQIDFFNATGYELEASAVEEMYVPDGCLSCDGNNVSFFRIMFALILAVLLLTNTHALYNLQLPFRLNLLVTGSLQTKRKEKNSRMNRMKIPLTSRRSVTTCTLSLPSATRTTVRTVRQVKHSSSLTPKRLTSKQLATSLRMLSRAMLTMKASCTATRE